MGVGGGGVLMVRGDGGDAGAMRRGEAETVVESLELGDIRGDRGDDDEARVLRGSGEVR